MKENEHVYAVLLAGGGGTRLWPKSHGNTPKQFLRLAGEQTMMQIAAERISKVVGWDHIIVVTNQKFVEEVQKQLPEIRKAQIIAEPVKRDTALAMLVGSLYAKSLDPEAVIINSASDHVVTDLPEFIRVMKLAAKIAATKPYLVAVGIIPQFPSSAFGYIKVGSDLQKLDRGLSLFQVESFTEKPNVPTALAFISTGKYFWNANMYVWSAKELVKAFEKYMPEMLADCQKLLTVSAENFAKELPAIYQKAEAISFDYAISEKTDNLVLIPGNFGWNDVGDWKVVYDLGRKDLNGNVIIADPEENPEEKVVLLQSERNLVHSNGRLISMIGISDLVVIDTPDALLICPKGKSQDVKKMVDKLKEEKKDSYL
jgi:mannose-1-phosphate guanylyltransferase